MSSLNKAMIIGRLGADPEVRITQNNTTVANMSVATTERYKDKSGERQESTEWHRVVVWGKLAEICQKYLTKGSMVYFEGKIQTRQWENKEGQKQYTTEINAQEMRMLDSRGEGNQGQPATGGAPASQMGDIDPDTDDDLPF